METIFSLFNVIWDVIQKVLTGFLEFLEIIPNLFGSISGLISQLVPQDFAIYLIAFIPIVITLLVIRFVKG